jgi:hypothetical protein
MCGGSNAQIVFRTADLPHLLGEYHRGYAGSNIDISGLIGPPGGPQRWDFSQSQAAGESIQRTDIVSPNDGGNGDVFTNATYAERLTREDTSGQSWEYFSFAINQGRSFYGFYDPVDDPGASASVFESTNVDLPDPIQFGQSWNRAVDWLMTIDLGFVQYQIATHFTASTTVDAYGTVVLPQIGEVPALRVQEFQTYEPFDLTDGIPLPTEYSTNYFWLVRGIGKAVEIDSVTYVPSQSLPFTNTFFRVFETSYRAATGVQILLQNGQAVLNWNQATNASGYRVESTTNLATTNWKLVSQPVTNTWSAGPPTAPAQQFFRVTLLP